MATRRATSRAAPFLVAAALWTLAAPAGARAELRISNLTVFLNDYDVTIQVVLLGAIPESLYESLQSGIATHVRFQVELWQYNRFLPDRRLTSRTIERHVTYSVLTKEYRVVSLKGEPPEEPYVTKDLREAQRVVSGFRAGDLAPASSLSAKDLYYVRVRADVSLGGVSSWIARFAGEAEETDWVRSDLLTVSRTQ
jgi:Domain of unknown function (DUF4390)